jgi:hypothetical protein
MLSVFPLSKDIVPPPRQAPAMTSRLASAAAEMVGSLTVAALMTARAPN